MANDNETVAEVCESVEYLCGTDGGGLEIFGEHINPISLAERILAAHNREMATKDAEIAQLKACLNGDCNRSRLGAEPCPGCHIQTNIDKIESLKSLVKELTDTLQKHFGCSGYCEGCMLTKLKYECKTKSDYELVRKAREAVK